MSNSVFASGWHVIDGTRGVDVLINTGTSTILSGNANVHWPNTATADAQVVSDWVAVDGLNATGAAECSAQYYSVRGHFRADNIAANKNLVFGVQLMNNAGNLFRNVLAWQNQPLPIANTWQSIGFTFTPTWVGKGRWMRVIAYRPNDIDFNLWLDSVEIRRLPPYALALMTAGGTFTGSWVAVTPSSLVSGHQVSISGTTLLLHQPGIYAATAWLPLSGALDDGDIFGLRIGMQQNAGAGRIYHSQFLGLPAAYATGAFLGITVSQIWDNFARSAAPAVQGPGNIQMEVIQLAGTLKGYGTPRMEVARVAE
jgi:hypothetical protein